jgi:hypothetical protein
MSSTVVITQTTAPPNALVLKYKEEYSAIPKDKLNETVKDAMNSEEVKTAANKNVRELAKTIREIRKLFGGVSGDLNSFDKDNFKDTKGNHLKLREKWQANVDVSQSCARSV